MGAWVVSVGAWNTPLTLFRTLALAFFTNQDVLLFFSTLIFQDVLLLSSSLFFFSLLSSFKNVLGKRRENMKLSIQNPHEFDLKTSFDEASHTYTHVETGRKFPASVTRLVQSAFPSSFNPSLVVESNLRKWATNRDSKYFVLIQYLETVMHMNLSECGVEIKKLWLEEGRKARDLGTELHLAMEHWMDGKKTGFGDHEYAVELTSYSLRTTFYPEMKLMPWRTEFRVFLTTSVCHPSAPQDERVVPVLSGTIDALFKDALGRLWVLDWKRSDPEKKGLLGSEVVDRFTKRGAGQFNSFFETSFHRYSLQLILYKLILERGGYLSNGQSVAGLFLVQIHPSLSKPHFVEALHGMDEHEQEAFETAANLLLDDHIEKCKEKEFAAIQAQMNAETSGEDEEEEEEEEEKEEKMEEEEV